MIPMWAPFFSLAVVCALPSRKRRRRTDWPRVAAWTCLILYCLAVWGGVAALVWWLVW